MCIALLLLNADFTPEKGIGVGRCIQTLSGFMGNSTFFHILFKKDLFLCAKILDPVVLIFLNLPQKSALNIYQPLFIYF
jgi:hypothetical protein